MYQKFAKLVLDVILIEGITFTYIGASLYGVYALVLVLVGLSYGAGIFVQNKSSPIQMPYWIAL